MTPRKVPAQQHRKSGCSWQKGGDHASRVSRARLLNSSPHTFQRRSVGTPPPYSAACAFTSSASSS